MESCQEWNLPYPTHFSGMDMASFALDEVPLGGITASQCWASDIWDQARAFCARNHSPLMVYEDVKHRPAPGPPVVFYVAGSPCQPWARGGKNLGAADHKAPLLDQVLETIGSNRPLAFLMEESDRVATYQGGQWWRARVAELQDMGYQMQWSILNAKHHGVPQNKPRLWVVGIRADHGRGQGFHYACRAAPPPSGAHLD